MLRPNLLHLVRDFCRCEPRKLRRDLIDRLRCAFLLDHDAAILVIASLEGEGLLRCVEISHYDPALEDMVSEVGVMASSRLLAAEPPE